MKPFVRVMFFALPVYLMFPCIGCSKQELTNPSENTEPTIKTDVSKEGNIVNTNKPSLEDITYVQVAWTDLLPDDDLEALENPPEYLTNVEDGSEEDQLTSQLKAGAFSNTNTGSAGAEEDRYQQALTSKKIRPEFNGRHIRIPGFIVPLEFDQNQTITTFFLVPFFGACLHMPPPPPNQIIYAEYEPGIRLEALYDPFWVDGKLHTTLTENEMATASYSITVAAIEPYVEVETQQWSDLEPQ